MVCKALLGLRDIDFYLIISGYCYLVANYKTKPTKCDLHGEGVVGGGCSYTPSRVIMSRRSPRDREINNSINNNEIIVKCKPLI